MIKVYLKNRNKKWASSFSKPQKAAQVKMKYQKKKKAPGRAPFLAFL